MMCEGMGLQQVYVPSAVKVNKVYKHAKDNIYVVYLNDGLRPRRRCSHYDNVCLHLYKGIIPKDKWKKA